MLRHSNTYLMSILSSYHTTIITTHTFLSGIHFVTYVLIFVKSDTSLKHIYKAQVCIILCCRLLMPMICSPKAVYISCVHWASGLNPLVSIWHTSQNWWDA